MIDNKLIKNFKGIKPGRHFLLKSYETVNRSLKQNKKKSFYGSSHFSEAKFQKREKKIAKI